MTIDELIVALETATEGSRELDAAIGAAVGDMNDPDFDPARWIVSPQYEAGYSQWDGIGVVAYLILPDTGEKRKIAWRKPKPYTTSLDAALTLVPSGWFYMLISGRPEMGYRCDLGRDELKHEQFIHYHDPAVLKARAATPPLSLCVTALKARVEVVEVGEQHG